MKLKAKYELAKEKKVGEEATCPSCGTKFIKTNYQQVFCKSKNGTVCKDYYWNNVTPTKRNNTTRISPANQATLDKWAEQKENRENFDDDQSWDAHKIY